jgi:hypothetical protein
MSERDEDDIRAARNASVAPIEQSACQPPRALARQRLVRRSSGIRSGAIRAVGALSGSETQGNMTVTVMTYAKKANEIAA